MANARAQIEAIRTTIIQTKINNMRAAYHRIDKTERSVFPKNSFPKIIGAIQSLLTDFPRAKNPTEPELLSTAEYLEKIKAVDKTIDSFIARPNFASFMEVYECVKNLLNQQMQEQIENVLERGRALDLMVEKTENLKWDEANFKKFSERFPEKNKRIKTQLQADLLLNINKDSKSVAVRNEQFKSLDLSSYNYHKNKKWDSFFGLHNTKSWRNTVSSIRKSAFDKLISEVEAKHTDAEKIQLLQDAKTMSIFNTHCNNSILFGAFWRTATVKKIDEEIKKYKPKMG